MKEGSGRKQKRKKEEDLLKKYTKERDKAAR